MKAMVIEQFGEPDVFIEKTVPRPELKSGHVLIEVRATSVNSVDVLIRRHGPPFLSPSFPAILHSDVAGIIVEVASDVKGFKPGDLVYGCAGGLPGMGGALAEFMLADALLIAHKPISLSMAEAAALPLVTLTVWEALRERVVAKSGQKVLVHGGAGGVGHIAVQLARIAGAQVYATVSTKEKSSIVKALSEIETIDYHAMPVIDYVNQYTGGKGFDIVFDSIGNENLLRSFEATKLNGNVVTTMSLGQFDMSMAHLRGLSLHVVFMLIPLLHNINRSHHGRILSEAAKLVDEGKLRPLIDPHRFTFNEVYDAHRLMESGKHIGKIVLTRE